MDSRVRQVPPVASSVIVKAENVKFRNYLLTQSAIVERKAFTLLFKAIECDVKRVSKIKETSGGAVPLTILELQTLGKKEEYKKPESLKAHLMTWEKLNEDKSKLSEACEKNLNFSKILSEYEAVTESLKEWLHHPNNILVVMKLLEKSGQSMLGKVIAEFKELFALAELYHTFLKSNNSIEIESYNRLIRNYLSEIRRNNTIISDFKERDEKDEEEFKVQSQVIFDERKREIPQQNRLWLSAFEKMRKYRVAIEEGSRIDSDVNESKKDKQNKRDRNNKSLENSFDAYSIKKYELIQKELEIKELSQKTLIKELDSLEDEKSSSLKEELVGLRKKILEEQKNMDKLTRDAEQDYNEYKRQFISSANIEAVALNNLDDLDPTCSCFYSSSDTSSEEFTIFYRKYIEKSNSFVVSFNEKRKKYIELANHRDIFQPVIDMFISDDKRKFKGETTYSLWHKTLELIARYVFTPGANIYGAEIRKKELERDHQQNFFYTLISEMNLLVNPADFGKKMASRKSEWMPMIFQAEWKTLGHQPDKSVMDEKDFFPYSAMQKVMINFGNDRNKNPIIISLGEFLADRRLHLPREYLFTYLTRRKNVENLIFLKDLYLLDLKMQRDGFPDWTRPDTTDVDLFVKTYAPNSYGGVNIRGELKEQIRELRGKELRDKLINIMNEVITVLIINNLDDMKFVLGEAIIKYNELTRREISIPQQYRLAKTEEEALFLMPAAAAAASVQVRYRTIRPTHSSAASSIGLEGVAVDGASSSRAATFSGATNVISGGEGRTVVGHASLFAASAQRSSVGGESAPSTFRTIRTGGHRPSPTLLALSPSTAASSQTGSSPAITAASAVSLSPSVQLPPSMAPRATTAFAATPPQATVGVRADEGSPPPPAQQTLFSIQKRA